jgi:adenosylcobinamide-GDP ribazoletransferase
LAAGGTWPAGSAFAAVFVGVALTGALHMDGLADWADAFGCMGDREKRLAVMKDPRAGPFGVVAIAVSLAAKWIAVTRLAEADAMIWVVAAYVVSRAMQVELASSLPYARAEGGTAGAFVSGAGWPYRLTSFVMAAVILGVLLGPAGIVSLLAGMAIAHALGQWSRLRLGGVTGDVLGATSEWVEAVLLFTAALVSGHLGAFTEWSALNRFVG